VRASLERRQVVAGWAFAAPALALFSAFFVIPVAGGLFLSATDFDVYGLASPDSVRFVGLANYSKLFRDPELWNAIRNTLLFGVLAGPLSVVTSLAAALLVSAKVARWKPFFRTVYFLPVVTTLVAVAIVWRYLYHPRYGALSSALESIGLGSVDWLGDPRLAMPAVVIVSVWKNFGYNMLIFIAGLQSIPEELHEAAAVDGASTRHRFLHVTLPSLAPVTLFVVVTTMIGAFQLFTEPYVMTQGGPLGATRSLALLLYEQGFRWWRMGIASAIAVVLLGITVAATLVQLRVRKSMS
jgi:multiple sugar transport system permease protein